MVYILVPLPRSEDSCPQSSCKHQLSTPTVVTHTPHNFFPHTCLATSTYTTCTPQPTPPGHLDLNTWPPQPTHLTTSFHTPGHLNPHHLSTLTHTLHHTHLTTPSGHLYPHTWPLDPHHLATSTHAFHQLSHTHFTTSTLTFHQLSFAT
ncbi:hypothetical protein Pcinc_001126 [Petrolisthes cinctipes]|uniref:Uncharacterized protein n=1 Tax=Petrolisthes cinctipes TaxID=88211 RepID=A0AAE1GNH4_PETCI|nr:hypothetical protein Pcinc_001126 [Petrolisthes cinctipes]